MPTRVVGIASRTLTISDGDWLLVKDRLNHGEQQDAFARKYVATEFGHRVDLRFAGMDKVTAYLLGWNLTGLDGHVLPLRNDAGQLDPAVMTASLNSIDPESFAEIHNAIEAHETAMAAARAEEKKLQAGATTSSPTSPSPAPATAPSATPTSES